MEKIKNKECINRLSYRILAARKKQNLTAVIAIILTTIMFTALFTVSSSMMKSFQKETMRQVGGSAMAGFKYILPEQYELFAKDHAVKNPSYRILIGNAVNNELLKMTTEVYYATEENAESMFCLPTHGTMPKQYKDIAASTLVLDTLKLPHELGETVTLEILVNGEVLKEEFTLCGYWEGDRIAMAQMCFLSEQYCQEAAPAPKVSIAENDYNYSGYWAMDFDFSNSWNIEKKTKELIKRNGYKLKEIDYGINWGYTFSYINIESIVCFLGIACLILVSGYLIIYNIFSLNVTMEIQSYGLYKTIGMTEKQLKRLVRHQAVFLSLVGIPIGCIFGVIFGKLLFPLLIKNYTAGRFTENSLHPLFLLFAAAFSFLTVWISCNKPCRLAAKVSAVEAVKYVDVDSSPSFKTSKTSKINKANKANKINKENKIDSTNKISSTKGSRQQQKKAGRKVTACSFGWANLGRNKKKVVLVVCSLSLSLILLNCVYIIVHGFSLEDYVSEMIIGDAMVGDASILNSSYFEKNIEGITPEMRKALADMEGIKESHSIYCNGDSSIFLDDSGMEKFNTMLENYAEVFDGDDFMGDYIKWIKEEKNLNCQLYGIDEWGTEQLNYFDGEMDWKKFQTGNYIIVSKWSASVMDHATNESYYKPKEKISLLFPNGTSKEYEVMAVAEMPYALSCRFTDIFGAGVVLPETEYLEHIETSKNSLWTILFMEKGNEQTGYENVRDYTEHVETGLDNVLKQTYEKEFDEYISMYWIVGGCLSLMLAVIGVVNFINAIMMGILARKREFAMMEAVGMTGRQLKQMLAWEGGFYALLTAAVSILAGAVLQKGIVEKIAGPTWFFEFHFTVMPIVICLPILVLIACLIPLIAYRSMAKESVVERIRKD